MNGSSSGSSCNGYAYCSNGRADDPDGDGWTGSASCIVTNSGPDSCGGGATSSSSSGGNNNGLALSNPNASSQAVALFQYIKDIYGQKTLTGQQEPTWMSGGAQYELNYIQQHTGRQPAILGLDYISPGDYNGVDDRATAWYQNRGGIPSIM